MYVYAWKERETGYTIWPGLLLYPFPRPVCVRACVCVCARVCVCTHVCVRVCLLSPVEGHRRDTYPLISLIKECCHPLMLFFSFPQQFVICFIWFYHIPGFAAIRRPSLLWVATLNDNLFFFLPSVRSIWPYREYVIKINLRVELGS